MSKSDPEGFLYLIHKAFGFNLKSESYNVQLSPLNQTSQLHRGGDSFGFH